ncbi:MAG: MarR family winged helix-turn-helix transcriptional regulator [Janthinobacterium lividum]
MKKPQPSVETSSDAATVFVAEQNDTSVNSHCNNAAIRRAARRVGQLYDDALAPCGLRATQYSLLNQIERAGSPTMRMLADKLVMDLSALGHTLQPLSRDGLLERVADADDRRSRRVHLTPAGIAKLREARRLWKQANDSFDTSFGVHDAARLRATLDLIASPGFAERLRTALQSARVDKD